VRESKPYDEKKVLELLAQGSEHAFTQVFDQYRPRIYRSALKFLKSQELAEEIVQEVFLKVWRRRGDLAGINNFNAYLLAMGRNLIFDSIKKVAQEAVANREFAYGRVHENGTEKMMLESQYEELLNKAVEQLPPQQKQIFKLAKVEGLSHEAIAEQLNLSRLTVKTHMAKALQFLRHRLQHHLSSFVFLATVGRFFER
jgi:RNA polymerase sigma-70 factor (family 1)